MIRRKWYLARHIASGQWDLVRLWVLFGQPLMHCMFVVYGPFVSRDDAENERAKVESVDLSSLEWKRG